MRDVLAGIAEIDNAALCQYLTDKKKDNNKSLQAPVISKPKEKREQKVIHVAIQPVVVNQGLHVKQGNTPPGKIHPENAHVIPAMEQRLRLRGYSPSTQKTYLNEVNVFCG